MMNMNLKTKILETGRPQIAIAHDLMISDSLLSKIVKGWVCPSEDIKARLALLLGCQPKDLFPAENNEAA